MRTLDKYILRLYLINFVILLVVLLAMFVLIDLLVNIDEFTQAGEVLAERASQTGGAMAGQTWYWTLYAIVDYFAPLLVLLFTFLSGLVATAAMGFTFSGLVKSGEVLAMLTAGISMHRIAMPVIVVGTLLNMLSLPIKEYVIPPMAHKLLRGQSDMKKLGMETQGSYFAPDVKGNLISYANLQATKGELSGVRILERVTRETPDGETERKATGRRFTADVAKWDTSRGGWVLNDAAILQRDPETRSAVRDLKPSIFVESSLSPDVLLLRRNARYIQMLSLQQLDGMSRNPNAASFHQSILLAMHSRFSLLVVHVLALLMTIPVFMQREPNRNATVQAAKAAGLCIGAWAFALIIMVMGGEYLNAMAAAWLPVVIFLPISAWMLQLTKT